MDRQSSINLQSTKRLGIYKHNDRSGHLPDYLIGGEVDFSLSGEEALTKSDQIIADAKAKQLAKNGRVQWAEDKVRMSSVVNLLPTHTLADVNNLAVKIAERFNWQVVQTAVHKDEGYKNDNGEKYINNHAHIEFVMLHPETGVFTGKKRDLGPYQMSELQDLTAKTLGMVRGRNYIKEAKEAKARGEKPKPPARRMEHYEYRRVMQATQPAQDAKRQAEADTVVLKAQLEQIQLQITEQQAVLEKQQRYIAKAQADLVKAADNVAKTEKIEKRLAVYQQREIKARNAIMSLEEQALKLKGVGLVDKSAVNQQSQDLLVKKAYAVSMNEFVAYQERFSVGKGLLGGHKLSAERKEPQTVVLLEDALAVVNKAYDFGEKQGRKARFDSIRDEIVRDFEEEHGKVAETSKINMQLRQDLKIAEERIAQLERSNSRLKQRLARHEPVQSNDSSSGLNR